jgi:hypothetical protein
MDVINKCLKRQEKLMFIPNVSDDIATDEYEEMKRKQDADRQKQPSLYIFSYTGHVRQYIMKTVNHRYFETFMIIFIIISTVQLANDNPLLDSASRGS